ncbi:putative membrane protein [Metamycoplasma subdolum]|uniref:Putative membrane protein n=1 Tax=Metamycoplasma subdolum TaxID=92407 RepID=A0A3M0A9J3_9BACT|nr:ECF transporter S component [Metamycoplasma subdolum]RMA79065.1 putative membrane protein [Metamycoplasma subdolum]WPB50588.1 ECF transporter S component [Metamycoplasma subdolum]
MTKAILSSFFYKLSRLKYKSKRLTVYEICLFGILLAIYMIARLVERFVFRGPYNISITYAIFIIFGIILGPWKGAFLGILSDTLDQIIFGVSTWMIEYAIIPAIIAFLSGIFRYLIYKDSKTTFVIGLSFLSFLTCFMIAFLLFNSGKIPSVENKLKSDKVSPLIVAIISSISLTLIWTASLSLLITSAKTRNVETKFKCHLFFAILITIFIILILTRWLWGPFAFINYFNRFLAKKSAWTYETKYFPIMIPIIFKSFIEIPVYALIIFAIFPIVRKLRESILFHTSKRSTY